MSAGRPWPAEARPPSAAPTPLSRKEFELLARLAGAGGRVLEREDTYQRVWGDTMARGDRSVDVFVRKLRQPMPEATPRVAPRRTLWV